MSIFLTVDEIVKATSGTLLMRVNSDVRAVSTDSRTIQKGELFIPLKGENFDGHNYINEVIEKGAVCVLTEKPIKNSSATVIQVQDTLTALQDIAVYYRKKLKCKLIGITGSNGKTTTKFFTENILSSKYKVYASKKSFNNHIGVPLTILALSQDLDFGILEIGMNHPGEIANLTKLADPDIALVTTVGRAHLMDFGGVDGIANEKGDIYRKSRSNAQKIFNLDNPSTKKLYVELKDHNSISFSETNAADVKLHLKKMTLTDLTVQGEIQGVSGEVNLQIFGKQNITNLMAAAGIALACGMTPSEIWEALPRCQTVWGRNMLVDLPQNAKMIFDGYNANPDSMHAVVENLADIEAPSDKIIILGDMLELGESSASMHQELGQLVGSKNFDHAVFIGQFAKEFEAGIKKAKFSKNLIISNAYEESLAIRVANMLKPQGIVVLKGSRGAKLERFVPYFKPLNWKVNS